MTHLTDAARQRTAATTSTDVGPGGGGGGGGPPPQPDPGPNYRARRPDDQNGPALHRAGDDYVRIWPHSMAKNDGKK